MSPGSMSPTLRLDQPDNRQLRHPDGPHSRGIFNTFTETLEMGGRRGEGHPETTFVKTYSKAQTFEDFRQ